jgi:peptide deformylase
MLRKIAQLGHPILRTRARELSREELLSASTQSFIDDLIETMRDANGAGLAAIQVYEPIRICVIEVGNNPRYPYKPKIPLTVLVNPEIEPLSDERFSNFEGCLSVPNLRGRVPRFAHIRVRGWDRLGETFDREYRGITAGTFQHEVDHLDGKVFVDRVQDSTTFTTWENFDRFEKERFAAYVGEIVARYGS